MMNAEATGSCKNAFVTLELLYTRAHTDNELELITLFFNFLGPNV